MWTGFFYVGLRVLCRGNIEQKLESFGTQSVPHSPSLVTHRPYIPDVGTGMVQSIFRLRYGLDDRIPDRYRRFSLLHGVRTEFEARQHFYSLGTGGLPAGGKEAGT
jgi:hypothetical protein